MKISSERTKINLALNLTRDYFTIKENGNVGVLYIENQNKIHVVILVGIGGNDFTIDLDNYLDEENIDVAIKYLIVEFKTAE